MHKLWLEGCKAQQMSAKLLWGPFQQCFGPWPPSNSVCSADVQLNQPAIHPSGQYVIQAAQGGWIKVSLCSLEFACTLCAVWVA